MIKSLLRSDALLPDEYLETIRRKMDHFPEKKLMFAVLEDGVTCYQNLISTQEEKGKRQFDEVEGWILEENSDWLFSFDNVCESIGLNPRYIRAGLMRRR